MTLLDIAGYGFSHYAGLILGIIGKTFLAGVGILFGGIFLTLFTVAAIIGIVIFAAVRGVEHGSLLKASGTFFRLAGLVAGFIIALVAFPLALILKASFLAALVMAIGLITLGYFAGFIVSEIMALRLLKFEFYIRSFNNLRYKINNIGND